MFVAFHVGVRDQEKWATLIRMAYQSAAKFHPRATFVILTDEETPEEVVGANIGGGRKVE